jgi:hypothetical protein
MPQNSGNPRGKRKWQWGRSAAARSKQKGEKEGVGRRGVSGILPVEEGRGATCVRRGAPAGSGALPVEVDGAEWRGAGEEGGFQSGGPRLGCCSGPGRRNGEVFDLFKLTSNGIDLI